MSSIYYAFVFHPQILSSHSQRHTHTFRADDLYSLLADSLSLGRNTLLQAKALATSWAHSSLSLSSLSVSCFLYLTPFRQDSAQPICVFTVKAKLELSGSNTAQDTGECATAAFLFIHASIINCSLCVWFNMFNTRYLCQTFFLLCSVSC